MDNKFYFAVYDIVLQGGRGHEQTVSFVTTKKPSELEEALTETVGRARELGSVAITQEEYYRKLAEAGRTTNGFNPQFVSNANPMYANAMSYKPKEKKVEETPQIKYGRV